MEVLGSIPGTETKTKTIQGCGSVAEHLFRLPEAKDKQDLETLWPPTLETHAVALVPVAPRFPDELGSSAKALPVSQRDYGLSVLPAS